MTRQIRNDVEHQVLKAYAAGRDLHRIAEVLDVPHGRVSLIVQDIARFNRAGARTLVAEWERSRGRAELPPALRRVRPPALAPPPAEPRPPAVVVEAEHEPVPASVVEPAPEPELLPALELPAGWLGWLCEPYGRRYRDNGPHGAPKRCGCRLQPIVVGGRS